MLLVVNYHYVARGRRADARAIFPVSVAALEAQLDALARDFEFVGQADVLAAVDEPRRLPERACLITFDDGLREQVELALPALDARGIPGVFFVCGRPLAEPHVLFAHKVHLLREAMADDDLLEAVRAHLGGAPADEPVAGDVATAAFRYDTAEAARLKYLLNVVLGPRRPEPVERLFAERFSESEVRDRLYASPAQVAELGARGLLGAHGYAHLPLAVLDPAAAREDVERSAAALESVAGARPRTFSYPYGTAAAVDAGAARAVGAAGFVAAFTLERAFNATLDEPLLLARLDTNDAPGGRSPLFAVADGEIELLGAMTPARTRYIEEAA